MPLGPRLGLRLSLIPAARYARQAGAAQQERVIYIQQGDTQTPLTGNIQQEGPQQVGYPQTQATNVVKPPRMTDD